MNSVSSMAQFYDSRGYLPRSNDESDSHILKFPSSVDDIFWAPPTLSSPFGLTPIKSEFSSSPVHSLNIDAMTHTSYPHDFTSYCPTPEWACNTPSSLLARYHYSHSYHTHIIGSAFATPRHSYLTRTPSSRYSKRMEPHSSNTSVTPGVRPTLTAITNLENFAPFSTGSPLTPLPESCIQSPVLKTPKQSTHDISFDQLSSPSSSSEYVATPTPKIPRRGVLAFSTYRLPALQFPQDLMKEEGIAMPSSDTLVKSHSPPTPSSTTSVHKRLHESNTDLGLSHKRPKLVESPRDSRSAPHISDPETSRASTHKSQRCFPVDVPIHDDFQGFYRRFPLCSFTSDEENGCLSDLVAQPEGIFNTPVRFTDLYTPRWVKGIGKTKQGMCPICAEGTSRGGLGVAVWLAMKQSAYNYHMLYKHGISSTSLLPFSPPIAFRTVPYVPKSSRQRSTMQEGHCHRCKKWIPMESVKKDIDVKVRELFWWKHAAQCHGRTHIEGEDGFFVEDAVHQLITQLFCTDSSNEHVSD